MRTCSILLSVDVSVHSYCVSLAPLPPSCFFYPAHVPPCRHPPPPPTYCQVPTHRPTNCPPPTTNRQPPTQVLLFAATSPVGVYYHVAGIRCPSTSVWVLFSSSLFCVEKASSRLPSPLPRVVDRGILPFHNSSALVDDNRSCTLMPRATPSQSPEPSCHLQKNWTEPSNGPARRWAQKPRLHTRMSSRG